MKIMVNEQIIRYSALVLLYSLVPYLIISIYKRNLPILDQGRQYNYKGKRSIFFIIIFSCYFWHFYI